METVDLKETPVKTAAINPKLPVLWHGGDYNPDQWLDSIEILREDIRLMKLSRCNVMTIGVFAWSALEPEEGVYHFEWLDQVFDDFEKNGLYINLATPSGARPPWLAQKYPEVLRVDAERRRHLLGGRHNHCFTSPVYRGKVRQINERLASRYAGRKALVLWHISNEFSGECHCELCQRAFREFLKARYGSLGALNNAWWTSFWSHTYTDWAQIESPSPIGECYIHGLNIDWKRFVTSQTIDFIKNEIVPIRRFTPDIPITTNLMGNSPIELNLPKVAETMDIVSWDSYPAWHSPEGDFETAQRTAMFHDLTRSLKGGKPFLLMESTPSMPMPQPSRVPKQKRPGMHRLTSLLAIASGSDSVMYFQWRKSRGAWEKFAGAVVGHEGHERTKTFRDVAEIGLSLERLEPVVGSLVNAEVGIIADWENWWGIFDCQGLHDRHKDYWSYIRRHHKVFFGKSISTDIIQEENPFESYKLIVAPMLYMVKPGVAERLERFVVNGGVLVLSFWSGIVDENDLCFQGGSPGPLRKLAGVWVEEMDCLYSSDSNSIIPIKGNKLGLSGRYKIASCCEHVHPEGAEVLAVYGSDYYKDTPALTSNKLGKGSVYYLAADADDGFLFDFYSGLIGPLAVSHAVPMQLPEGVIARKRVGAGGEFLFMMNFNAEPRTVIFAEAWTCIESGERISGRKVLPAYGALCLRR